VIIAILSSAAREWQSSCRAAGFSTPAPTLAATPRRHSADLARLGDEGERIMEYVTMWPDISLIGMPYDLPGDLRGWYRKRRMPSALAALDDAVLKDIGVRRCEIPRIARTRFASERT